MKTFDKVNFNGTFRTYQQNIVSNAKALADGLLKRGFDLVSGGTDNHLMLVDLRKFGLTGLEMEHRLDAVRITANKNAIPFDPAKVTVTSGLRLGTPAVTTRGFTPEDMDTVAECIYRTAVDPEGSKSDVLAAVDALVKTHPLYE